MQRFIRFVPLTARPDLIAQVQVQVQVYFALFTMVQYKMAYRISGLTNDEK